MSLRNISVSTRASLSFAVMALIVLLVGGLSLLQMQRMNENTTQVEQNWLPSILALDDMSREFLRVRALTLRLFVNRDAQHRAGAGADQGPAFRGRGALPETDFQPGRTGVI